MRRMRARTRRRRRSVSSFFLSVFRLCHAANHTPSITQSTPPQVLLSRPEFDLLSFPTVATQLAPLTLAQHLHAPFDAMQRYETQLQALLEATPDVHPDHGPLLVRVRFGWVACDKINEPESIYT